MLTENMASVGASGWSFPSICAPAKAGGESDRRPKKESIDSSLASTRTFT